MTTAIYEETLLDTLRRNALVLGELAMRYDIETQPDHPKEDRPTISAPRDVHEILAPEMAHLAQEHLRVLLLNAKNQVVGMRVIYVGNFNSSYVRPAEVLRPAVVECMPNIIISHNHPSHDPTPSPEDVAITRTIVQAGKLLGIDVLDHVVIGGTVSSA